MGPETQRRTYWSKTSGVTSLTRVARGAWMGLAGARAGEGGWLRRGASGWG
jgi:hypothetical protein